MATDKQRITLNIGVHNIPLTVDRDKEEIYRKACKMLNESYRQYESKYPKESVERLWIYVALQIACNLHSDARAKAWTPVEEKLKELNQLIAETLTSVNENENVNVNENN